MGVLETKKHQRFRSMENTRHREEKHQVPSTCLVFGCTKVPGVWKEFAGKHFLHITPKALGFRGRIWLMFFGSKGNRTA